MSTQQDSERLDYTTLALGTRIGHRTVERCPVCGRPGLRHPRYEGPTWTRREYYEHVARRKGLINEMLDWHVIKEEGTP